MAVRDFIDVFLVTHHYDGGGTNLDPEFRAHTIQKLKYSIIHVSQPIH